MIKTVSELCSLLQDHAHCGYAQYEYVILPNVYVDGVSRVEIDEEAERIILS